MILKAGSTSQSIYVEILDSTSTTGGRKTGLAYNTSSLVAYYVRPGGSATAITLATLAAANSAYSSGGFKEVDATNMPGVYRLDIPDAAIAASAAAVVVTLKGATGMVQVSKEIVLTALDLQTALPSNFATLVIDGSGRVDVSKIAGTSQTARDIGASVLLSAGTGTGQLDFTSGVVKANLAQILGTALTETAGLIAAGFKQFFNIASPTSTMNTITTVTTATNLTNAPTSGDLTATMKTSVTTAATAATPTVAAVTGNVSGNVTGSVGSVATGGITAASIAADAITAAKIADGAIDAATFASGAITAAAIAADAIGASELAADAVAEIQSGLMTSAGYTTPPTVTQIRTEMDTNSTKLANLNATVSSRSTLTSAEVNAEVVDALTVDTYAEPSAVVGATASIKDMLSWVKALARNKITQTATTQTLFKDDGSTTLATSTTSDNGTTATRGEFS